MAFELGLPWRVEELRAKALEAYRTAEPPSAALGLPHAQVDERMLRRIYEEVMKVGEGMDALPPGEEKPATERIEAALGTFTVEEWRTLLESLGHVDVEALVSFIRQDAYRLKQRLGAREVGRIEERASLRATILWLENNRSKLVAITDPYWASERREQARQANCVGKGHPAKGRSLAEQASARSIARGLSKRDEQIGRDMKVSHYEVRQWWKREEQLPYERFVDEEGDEVEGIPAFIRYWGMIRRKHQRKRD